jgi:hypothetical protein
MVISQKGLQWQGKHPITVQVLLSISTSCSGLSALQFAQTIRLIWREPLAFPTIKPGEVPGGPSLDWLTTRSRHDLQILFVQYRVRCQCYEHQLN